MSINDSKSMDCKYCVSVGTDSKTETPFYCKIKCHNVSKKSCVKCDKRVYLNQMSLDNKNDW